ncbi:MAG: VOC family protein [Gammaproteobacteria bacterium]|nr:VOC family protein [Gammaproteobacteria bacterium]
MISYLTLGTNDIEKAVAFYDALMAEMGAEKVYAVERSVGWGWGVGTPMFIVTKPFNEQPATHGGGTMIAFDAKSKNEVDRWYAKVMDLGGTDEGAPGMRGEHMYVAYCRDLDGNKFNFIHYLPPAP